MPGRISGRKRVLVVLAAIAIIVGAPGTWLALRKFRHAPQPAAAPKFSTPDEDPRWAEYDDAAEQWELLKRPLRSDIPTIAGLILRYRRQTVPSEHELPFERYDELIKRIDAAGYLKLTSLAEKAKINPDERMLAAYAQRMEDLGDFFSSPASDALENWVSILMYCERQAALDRSSANPVMFGALSAGTPRMSLQLVEFRAERYLPQVPRPEKQELEDFFQQHRALSPREDPMGIGYRIPRVSLEYVAISPRQIQEALSDDDLQEPPAKAPGLLDENSARIGAIKLTPTTQPAAPPTRFEDLTDQQKQELRQRHARRAADGLAADLRRRMLLDSSDSAESPGRSTRAGVPYRSAEYLRRLVAAPNRWTTVRPAVSMSQEPLPVDAAGSLPRIGGSRIAAEGEAFGQYLAQCVDQLISADPASQSPRLALYEPSPVLIDAAGNLFIFRIVEADRGVAPEASSSVASLQADWAVFEAYALARQAAEELEAGLREQPLESLISHKSILETGLLPAAATTNRDPAERSRLMQIYERACDMRTAGYAHHQLHPSGIIELKSDRSVYLARVVDDPWR